jgi:hypothetical protein
MALSNRRPRRQLALTDDPTSMESKHAARSHRVDKRNHLPHGPVGRPADLDGRDQWISVIICLTGLLVALLLIWIVVTNARYRQITLQPTGTHSLEKRDQAGRGNYD